MAVATQRKTADERRVAILDAALVEFGEKGLDGASTDAIARAAGISQPYLFRLFGTKKELFKASVERCLRETLEAFQEAAAGKQGEEALQAIGSAYLESITSDPTRLRGQMQAYVACDDEEICAVVRTGFGRLVEFVEGIEGVSGLDDEKRVVRFFGHGMLLNVFASMHLLAAEEPWAKRLLDACRGDVEKS
jgi:AcrR family transcriptional regulator